VGAVHSYVSVLTIEKEAEEGGTKGAARLDSSQEGTDVPIPPTYPDRQAEGSIE